MEQRRNNVRGSKRKMWIILIGLGSLEQSRPELLLYTVLVGLHQFSAHLLLLFAFPFLLLFLGRRLRHNSALLLLFHIFLLFFLFHFFLLFFLLIFLLLIFLLLFLLFFFLLHLLFLFFFLLLLFLLYFFLFIEKEGPSAIDNLKVIVIDAELFE